MRVRSADAAHASARAAAEAVEEARRANELTITEMNAREAAKVAEDFQQARLVRGCCVLGGDEDSLHATIGEILTERSDRGRDAVNARKVDVGNEECTQAQANEQPSSANEAPIAAPANTSVG